MQPGVPSERQRAQIEALQRVRLAIQNDRPAEAERLASAAALTLFVAKRLIAGFLGLFVAKPKRPPVTREKVCTGPLTEPASVRLPQHLRN